MSNRRSSKKGAWYPRTSPINSIKPYHASESSKSDTRPLLKHGKPALRNHSVTLSSTNDESSPSWHSVLRSTSGIKGAHGPRNVKQNRFSLATRRKGTAASSNQRKLSSSRSIATTAAVVHKSPMRSRLNSLRRLTTSRASPTAISSKSNRLKYFIPSFVPGTAGPADQLQRRVRFSDVLEVIPPDLNHEDVLPGLLWWNSKDRSRASEACAEQIMRIKTSEDYENAAVLLLTHCRKVALSGVEEASRGKLRMPKSVYKSVLLLVEVESRGLERALFRRLQSQFSGSSCYYWRGCQERARNSVLELQGRLYGMSNRLVKDSSTLLAAQYKPYALFATTWARLLAVGDEVDAKTIFLEQSFPLVRVNL